MARISGTMRTYVLVLAGLLALPASAARVLVYGGTPAGVAAAVTAARLGNEVVLIDAGGPIGGVVSGGLTASDVGDVTTIGGFPREFFDRCLDHYVRTYGADSPQVKDSRNGIHMEPRVAREQFEALLAEARVEVLRGFELSDCALGEGQRIVSINVANQAGEIRTLAADGFVDASYEGDLMARARVPYRVGRESRAEYQEPNAGIRSGPPGVVGQGDHLVQAYNFRLCLTDREELRVLPAEPAGYDRARYRRLLAGLQAGKAATANPAVFNMVLLPNGKYDANNGYSWQGSDWVGANYAYPEADSATRRRIAADHLRYVQGLLYFAQNDPEVPEAVRQDMRRYGLPRDEFEDNAHWPTQLYVREARRMIGATVLTEHDVRWNRYKPDGIAVGSYTIDCHGVSVRPHPVMGFSSEGGIGVPTKPYEIPYGVICPPEHPNLLVPVCCSATHVAYGSLRMEPVYMMLGQAAADALHIAAAEGVGVRDVPVDKLRALLLEQSAILGAPYYPEVSIKAPEAGAAGQQLSFEAVPVGERTRLKDYWWDLNGDAQPDATGPVATCAFERDGSYTIWLVARDEAGKWTNFSRAQVTIGGGGSRELLIDNEDRTQVRSSGPWLPSHARPLFHGDYYNHNVDDRTGRTAWRFVPKIESAGRYRLLLGVIPDPNRATNVPVTVYHADGETTLSVDQRADRGPFPYVDLGIYRFEAGTAGSLLLRSEGVDGYVVVDSLRLVPQP